MKKYFKTISGIYLIQYPDGILGIILGQGVDWYKHTKLEEFGTPTECTREECEAAYKQTIKFLNDKINGN